MAIRIPLPGKVLLSYLLVVAVGALPTFVYLKREMVTALEADAQSALSDRIGRLVRALSPPDVDRVAYLDEVSRLLPERVTLVASSGTVLFDSRAKGELRSYAERAEIIEAQASGSGAGKRSSLTTGAETLYVARRIGAQGSGDILRLGTSVEGLKLVSDRTVAVLRNAQAVAVSLALGLSLLAAMVLVRPLSRVRTAAEALAAGDFGVQLGKMGNDEIGDVGRALDALMPELRRRMAIAGAGEAMLVQLVEVLNMPVAIFEIDGKVLTLNGAARRLLQIEGPSAGQRLREMLDDESLKAALVLAEEEGQPEPVRLRFRDRIVEGASVFVLKRPGAAPLGLLLAPALPQEESQLPSASDVTPLPLAVLIERAQETANGSLADRGVELRPPSDLPEVALADAQGRLTSALSRTLLSCAGTFAGRPGRLKLDVEVEPTRVGLRFDAATGGDDLGAIRPLLEPLGGTIDAQPGETTLWLPRA